MTYDPSLVLTLSVAIYLLGGLIFLQKRKPFGAGITMVLACMLPLGWQMTFPESAAAPNYGLMLMLMLPMALGVLIAGATWRALNRRSRSRHLGLLLSGFVALFALLPLLSGVVVLIDPHREVLSAHLVNGLGESQELADLGVAHATRARLEGPIEIKCTSGKVVRSGYVTPGAPMWERMGTRGECSPV